MYSDFSLKNIYVRWVLLREVAQAVGSDDTRGYGAGSGDVGKELPRGMIP